MWLRRAQFVLSVAIIPGLTACVPISPPDQELFTAQKLAFIEIGKTTKDEVAGELTHYAMKIVDGKVAARLYRQEYRDGDWWLYAQARQNRDWLILVPEAGEVEGGTDYRFLLIKFDERGVVSEYELSAPGNGKCGKEGVCLLARLYALLATAEEDRAAKQFEVPTGRCSVYLYGRAKFLGVSVHIDARSIGPLVNDEHFYLVDLEPGTYRLIGNSPAFGDSDPMKFECASGEMFFFNLEDRSENFFNTRYWVSLERHDEETGRRAVAERRLTLMPAPDSRRRVAIRTREQELNLLRTVGLFEGLEKRGNAYFEPDSGEPFSGVRTTSFPDGSPAASVELRNGMLDGVYSIWDENGTKRRETRYEEGAVIDDQVWCPDGSPAQHPLLKCGRR